MTSPMFPNGTRSRADSALLNKFIIERYAAGVRPGKIALEAGVRKEIIYARMVILRDSGLLREPLGGFYAARHVLVKRGGRLGNIPEIFDSLTPEVAKWVAESTPDGMSASEFISSIIVDAYNTEMDSSVEACLSDENQ